MSGNLRAPAKAAATPQLPSNKRKATLGDAKVQSMLAVTECCNDLSTARDVLYDVHDVLLNYNASKSTRKATANNLMKVLQYLDKAITSLKEHSNKLSPMAHLLYAIGRQNKAQKMETLNSHRNLTPMQHITSSIVNGRMPATSPKASKPRAAKMSNKPSKAFHLPPPKNGRSYERKEFLELVEQLPENKSGPGGRSEFIDEVLKSNLVPVKRSAIYSAIKKLKDHVANGGTLETFENLPWHSGRGAQPKLTDEHVEEIAAEINNKPGSTLTKPDLLNKIMQKEVERQKREGNVVLQCETKVPSRTTVSRYFACLSLQIGTSLVASAVSKTPTRFTAELSIRSSLSFAAVVAATHLMVTEEEKPDVHRYLSTAASESEKFMIKTVSQASKNCAVTPVRSCYLASIDETGEYIFKGTSDAAKGQKLIITSTDTLESRSVRSSYIAASKKSEMGMRIKLAICMTAGGSLAPVLVSITGLNERELSKDSCPSGFLYMEVNDLCVGGGGINPNSMGQPGYVCFIQNEGNKGTDKSKFELYRDKILLPFVERLRARNGDSVGKDAPTFVTWCDGDLAQLATTVDETTLARYEEVNIVANKQSAARSATEQAADLSPIFKILHDLQKGTTATDKAIGTNAYKDHVRMMLDIAKAQANLRLPTNKTDALLDYLACLPQMLTKAVSVNSLQKGFRENGMLSNRCSSKTPYAFPCFDSMLSTCRKVIPTKARDLCKEHFPTLVAAALEHGHVPEDIYDKLEFPMDQDVEGNPIPKNQGISQEHRQRAKCLTHRNQVKLREKRLESAMAAMNIRHAEKVQAFQNLVQMHDECVTELKKLAPEVEEASQLELVHFSHHKIQVKHLKGYIHARSWETVEKPKNHQWKNKGNLQQAQAGIDCLILQAHKLRSASLKLKDVPAAAVKPAPPPPRHESATIITSSGLNPFDWGAHHKPASELLSNESWRNLVTSAWRRDAENINHSTHQTTLDLANKLQSILLSRLQKHVKAKIEEEKLSSDVWSHWCLHLTASKLGNMAAIMVLLCQVVEDLDCNLDGKCLLVNNLRFRRVTPETTEDGVYLYYNRDNSTWIRAGMVALRDFNKRGMEHKKGSQLKTPESKKSNFYTSYPSKCSVHKVEKREGLFENLEHRVALGYDLRHSEERLVSIFELDEAAKNNISKGLNFSVRGSTDPPSVEKKQRRAIHYLCEMAYGLCLADKDNVSRSPGWEQALKVYG
jgi:hypothetical protein